MVESRVILANLLLVARQEFIKIVFFYRTDNFMVDIFPPHILADSAVPPFHPRASPRRFVWGNEFIGTQVHLPPKFSFSSDFGHFIF